jgi:hypothetical protein
MNARRVIVFAARALACGALVSAVGPLAAAAADEAEPIEARCHDVAVREGLAVLGRTGGIITLDVSNPVKAKELGRLGLRATVLAVALEQDRAWLAAGAYGLARVDLSDPASPSLEHRIDVPGKVREVIPLGERVLLAESRHGLSVMDVSDPARPRRTASVSTRDEVRALALCEGMLAIAEELAGVRLFDVTRPDTPRELAQIDLEGANDLTFVEGLLLVAAGRNGLVTIDVSRPRSPRFAGVVPPARSAQTVAPHGRLALVGNGSAGVQIIEPSAPDGPRLLQTIALSGRYPAGRLAAEGSTVFVAADLGGLVILDVEKIDEPRVLLPRDRRMRIRMP